MVNPGETGPWLGESGPDSDVVLSSRVRLARNLAGVPFVNRASDADRNEVVGIVRRTPLFAKQEGSLHWVEMEDLKRVLHPPLELGIGRRPLALRAG